MAKRVPSLTRHKPTGQARVRIDGRDFYLGKHGSTVSEQRYHRLIAEWLSSGVVPARPAVAGDGPADNGPTVNELLLTYWKFCAGYYRDADGEPTKEQGCIKLALRPVKKLYGTTMAANFGPQALKAVRQHLIDADSCRTSINRTVGRIKRVFKWGVENEMIPPAVWHGLQAVSGLRAGRTDARESEPVRPVPQAQIDAVLPLVTPQIGAMIQLQRLSAMRPGEIVAMKVGDLKMTGHVWVFEPKKHKTAWRGHRRQVFLDSRRGR